MGIISYIIMGINSKVDSLYYGGVMVSTGILQYSKRVEAHALFKTCNLNLNAEDNNLAFAA